VPAQVLSARPNRALALTGRDGGLLRGTLVAAVSLIPQGGLDRLRGTRAASARNPEAEVTSV